MALTPLSTAALMGMSSREYILIAGMDGTGKSSAIVSIAHWVQTVLNPGAKFYIIDTENKFPTALRSFGLDAPTNIVYYKCENMNDAVTAMDEVMTKRKPDDWLAAESMARMWEKAQDLGYMAVSGYEKSAYLEIRRNKPGMSKAAVIPRPDDFWNVVKGAHDGGFVDLISQAPSLNVVMSTTVSKPPKDNARFKENETRKAVRLEFGVSVGLDGAPRLPTYVETTCLLEANDKGGIQCRVLRDNLSNREDPRPIFDVDGKKAFASAFWVNCR